MQRLSTLAIALAVIGAINWGLVGSLRFNLVSRALGLSTRAERIVYMAVGLAGLWLGLVFAWPRILIGLRLRGEKQTSMRTGHHITGKVMPTINGRTLNGEAVTIPEDTMGKLALLATGFALPFERPLVPLSTRIPESTLDRDGTALFQCGGPYDQRNFEELSSLLEAALSKAGDRERKAA